MPNYKCRRCGNEITLSAKPGQCEICGASQFKIISQGRSKSITSNSSDIISQSSPSTFSASKTSPPTLGQTSYQSFLSAYKLSSSSKSHDKYSPPSLPLYSSPASSPSSKSIPQSLSNHKKKFTFPFRWVCPVIILLLGLVGYWHWQLQFDTSEFHKIILQEPFKNSKFWFLTEGATIKNGGLYQRQSLANHYGASIWKKKNFQDVDFSADVIKATGPDDIPFGLITKVSGKDYQNFYYLFIDGKGDFVMGKHSQTGWTNKIGWKKSRVINPKNHKNHLRIVCKGNLIIGFINGKIVGSFRDESYTVGKIAVFSMRGKGKEIGIYFDNVLLRERGVQAKSTTNLN